MGEVEEEEEEEEAIQKEGGRTPTGYADPKKTHSPSSEAEQVVLFGRLCIKVGRSHC